MANTITGSRIILSIFLLFCTPFSPVFYALYLTAGLTDMIDGTVARKTDTVSEFGGKLDTIADIVFTVVCMIIILPLIEMPVWIYLWITGIALIKFANIFISFIRLKKNYLSPFRFKQDHRSSIIHFSAWFQPDRCHSFRSSSMRNCNCGSNTRKQFCFALQLLINKSPAPLKPMMRGSLCLLTFQC